MSEFVSTSAATDRERQPDEKRLAPVRVLLVEIAVFTAMFACAAAIAFFPTWWTLVR
jgi:hypothetical protein